MSRALSPALAAAVVISTLGLAGCKPDEHAAADPRSGERLVQVSKVEPATAAAGRYTGVVGARVQSDLGFRIQGKVVERLVDTGQVVKKGQPLMRIDPTDYVHAVTAQTGNVAAARARWIQADADERRYRGLVETGAESRSAYDQVKAAADSAKALLDAAEAQQHVTRNQEDYSVLLADSDGTVMETLVEPGQVVAAGEIVVRLAHAGPREAIVNLPETVRPALGSSASAFLYGDDTQVTAKLRQLSDAADPRTRTFEARYVMTGGGADAPLGATVTIGVGGDKKPVLAVPLGALDDEGNGAGVWIVDRATMTVSYLPVHVQSLGAELADVSGDLPLGATVVAVGGHYLHKGDHVRVADAQAAMQ
jgi:RND family efflux transporter MFP subunit